MTRHDDDVVQVAVNLTWCAPGRVGGSEEYLVRQLVGAARVATDDVPMDLTVHLGADLAAARPELGMHHLSVTRWPVARRAARIMYEHGSLAYTTRTADIVHHGGGTAPLWGATPRVVTVHDLQFRHLPEYFSRGRLTYLRAMMPQSVRRAAVVCTPTAYVASDVCAAYGIDADRVVVVPHGMEPLVSDEATVARVRHDMGATERPFLVYPAITHPHKGHRRLLEAMTYLDDDIMLVLCGGQGAAEAQVMADIERHGLSHRVVRTGRVPMAVRDALIVGADALVFPSEYEGFGAPLVEAMSAGTPVIAADIGALREVADNGTAARLVGTSAREWADAIRDVLASPDDVIAAGHQRAQNYTLAASGAALIGAYQRALEAR